MNKKSFALFTIVLVLTSSLLTGCMRNKPNDQNYILHKDRDLGVSFRFPKGICQVSKYVSLDEIESIDLNDMTGIAAFQIRKHNDSSGLDRWIQVHDYLKDFNELSKVNFKGLDAYYLKHTNADPLAYDSYVVEVEDSIYVINYRAPYICGVGADLNDGCIDSKSPEYNKAIDKDVVEIMNNLEFIN